MKKNIFFLFFSALLIRLISLNQSFWLDEATSAMVVKTYSFVDIIRTFSPNDFHPPFYYLLMKVLTSVFGYSEIALRAPSVAASVLTGGIIYKIVKNQKSLKSNAGWAAALFLFNPLIIYYSQEARMYSLVTLLAVLIVYYLLRVNELTDFGRQTRMYIVLCNLFIFVSLVTFYGSIFFIVAMYLYLIYGKQYRLFMNLLPGTILASLLLSPLFIQQLNHSGEMLKLIPNWSATLGKANMKNLLLIPLKFSVGRVSWEPKILYYVVSGAWTLFVMWNVFAYFNKKILKPNFATHYAKATRAKKVTMGGRVQDDKKAFVFVLFVAPLVLGFLISFYKPLLQYFRFIYVVPFMSILLALNTYKWQKYVLLTGFIGFSLLYLLIPQFHREDWKTMASQIPQRAKVYMVVSSSDPLKYYRPDIEIRELHNGKFDEGIINVVPYTSDIHGVDYKKALLRRGKKLDTELSYRGLTLEVWK